MDLTDFYSSSQFSDLTVYAGDKQFKVHKLVVCGQCGWFSRLFHGGWKETADNVVRLNEDDPQLVEAMIHFMYGLNYENYENNNPKIPPMLLNVRLYQIADKYDIPALKKETKEKFCNRAATCWESDDFPLAIIEAYTTTPKQDRGLRDIIVEVSCNHMSELLKRVDFLQVLEEETGFAIDMLQFSVSENYKGKRDNIEKRYRCPHCQFCWSASLVDGVTPEYHCPNCGECL